MCITPPRTSNLWLNTQSRLPGNLPNSTKRRLKNMWIQLFNESETDGKILGKTTEELSKISDNIRRFRSMTMPLFCLCYLFLLWFAPRRSVATLTITEMRGGPFRMSSVYRMHKNVRCLLRRSTNQLLSFPKVHPKDENLNLSRLFWTIWNTN